LKTIISNKFKICAQTGRLWTRRRLGRRAKTLKRVRHSLISNTLVKFVLDSLDTLAQLINIVDLHIVHLTYDQPL